MEYRICKLKFKTAVHFGKGRLSGSNDTLYADTIFSAFCQEAMKLFGEEGIKKLYEAAKNKELVLSDAMPYKGKIIFIPKPIISINSERESNSTEKKKFKKLNYIPIQDLESYMNGEYEPSHSLELLSKIGKSDIRIGVAVNKISDNEPFNIGTYKFYEDSGLYFIIGTENEETDFYIEDIMNSLSYTGIGGKLSAGYGKFDYISEVIDKDLKRRIEEDAETYMSLTISMGKEQELEKIVENSSYKLIKRSGFVSSENYAQTAMKKQDFYCFKGGSCFKKKFEGDIFDVSYNGNHPVYRYAKPILIKID